MNTLTRIRKVIREATKIYKVNPFIDKYEAFKRAYAVVISEEEKEYKPNGNPVGGLIGTHSSSDWTY
jgi:hypothetical protein